MATQLAATPTLQGIDAQNLLKSLEIKPTEKSKATGESLIALFKKIEQR